MADLILKREDLKREFEMISLANQSIRDIARTAGCANGLCQVTALTAIHVISELSMHSTPSLNDVFYPEGE